MEICFFWYQSTNYKSSSRFRESECIVSYTSEVLEYLTEVVHEDSESQATRFLHKLTGIGICNNKKFGLSLPLYKTKRKMYEQYCVNNGWKV